MPHSRTEESLDRMRNRFDYVSGPDFARIARKFLAICKAHGEEAVRMEIRTGLSGKGEPKGTTGGYPQLWFRPTSQETGERLSLEAVEEEDDDDYSWPSPPF